MKDIGSKQAIWSHFEALHSLEECITAVIFLKVWLNLLASVLHRSASRGSPGTLQPDSGLDKPRIA